MDEKECIKWQQRVVKEWNRRVFGRLGVQGLSHKNACFKDHFYKLLIKLDIKDIQR